MFRLRPPLCATYRIKQAALPECNLQVQACGATIRAQWLQEFEGKGSLNNLQDLAVVKLALPFAIELVHGAEDDPPDEVQPTLKRFLKISSCYIQFFGLKYLRTQQMQARIKSRKSSTQQSYCMHPWISFALSTVGAAASTPIYPPIFARRHMQ